MMEYCRDRLRWEVDDGCLCRLSIMTRLGKDGDLGFIIIISYCVLL